MSLSSHLAELTEKHRTIDQLIARHMARPGAVDEAEVRKLKHQKLKLKDRIRRLSS
jgi:hypothetical protein